MKIIVDIYGADRGPETVIKGALKAMETEPELEIIFSGKKEETEEILRKNIGDISALNGRISFIDAPLMITNDDTPMCIVKGGDGTSLAEAMKALKKREDVCGLVSCGNTGAVLVGSIFIIGLEKGLKKPALASLLPTCDGKMICVADCGANIDCKQEEMVIFAKLGSELIKNTYGIENPTVGILSLGKEPHKGNMLTHAVFEKLSESELNFIGNVEPEALYTGEADVIVCDGFTGNILLKNTEAAGHNILERIEKITAEEKDPNVLSVIGKIKEEIARTHEFNSRGGAIFLGTTKKIVKGHGAANEDTVCSCILQIIGKNQFFASASK